MNNGNLILKKINLLGSKANELMTKNKLLLNEIKNYQQLFANNKNYITSYFTIMSKKKKDSKNNIKNNTNTNAINNNIYYTDQIKDIIIKYNSEIKDNYLQSKERLKTTKLKHSKYLSKLISDTKTLSENYEKISEDNFLYCNAIESKENFIKCLKKDLTYLKSKLFEDTKHIYLNYNFQNLYKITNQTQTNSTTKNDSVTFEDGEFEIKDLLMKERQKFIIRMKLRNDIRLKSRKMNVKKNALNDLVTSISFINKTEVVPSKNNNIFQILNKKIGGVIKNYEKYRNGEDEEEIIDENYFIFLPFELEINKEEITELVQTDITLPNVKLQSKSINEYKKEEKRHVKNRSFINVPKLNFLQIEFNKEKISYSDCESDEKKNENDIKNNNNKDNANNNNDNNKKKNKNEELDSKIKQIKIDIKILKKKNRKIKRLINDFEKFQKKIEDKFIIFEKKILKEKEKESYEFSFSNK